MAKQNNNTAVNDVYTGILALASLTVLATAVYVAVVCYMHYSSAMWNFTLQAAR